MTIFRYLHLVRRIAEDESMLCLNIKFYFLDSGIDLKKKWIWESVVIVS